MYDEMLNEKYKEVQILEKQIYDQGQIAIDEVKTKQNLNSALALINSIIDTRELTKKQVLLLVDKIIVHEDTSINFYLKESHTVTNLINMVLKEYIEKYSKKIGNAKLIAPPFKIYVSSPSGSSSSSAPEYLSVVFK